MEPGRARPVTAKVATKAAELTEEAEITRGRVTTPRDRSNRMRYILEMAVGAGSGAMPVRNLSEAPRAMPFMIAGSSGRYLAGTARDHALPPSCLKLK